MSSLSITGIIPSAGFASRLPKLSFSKELYPITGDAEANESKFRQRVVSDYLLQQMKRAGAERAISVIRKEKWDIPSFYEDGGGNFPLIAYVVTPPTSGAAHSIQKAIRFTPEANVLLGFPDIILNTPNPFSKIVERLQKEKADLVLGLFKATNPNKVDMVTFDEKGVISDIVIKPKKSDLTYTWLIAGWTPKFSRLFSKEVDLKFNQNPEAELHPGAIFRDLLDRVKTSSVLFDNVSYLDIGTPEDLLKIDQY